LDGAIAFGSNIGMVDDYIDDGLEEQQEQANRR